MAQTSTASATQLYLVLQLADTEPSVERLSPLFDPALLPSLLIVPDKNRTADVAALHSLIAVAQHQGVAVLIADDCELAEKTGADGVHLTSASVEETIAERFSKARKALGPNAIIGADAGVSRHDAMELGEEGADYVAFSPQPVAALDEASTPQEAQAALASWWAAIFEVPVVALDVPDDESARQFAEYHVDFVARKLPAGLSAADLRDWLLGAHAALASDQAPKT